MDPEHVLELLERLGRLSCWLRAVELCRLAQSASRWRLLESCAAWAPLGRWRFGEGLQGAKAFGKRLREEQQAMSGSEGDGHL